MTIFKTIIAALAVVSATSAYAEKPLKPVKPVKGFDPFTAESLKSCISGRNLSEIMEISNPERIIGSVIYIAKNIGDGKPTIENVPLELPFNTSDVKDSITETCNANIQTTGDVNIDVLGVGKLTASGDSLYHFVGRKIAQFTVAPVLENGKPVTPTQAAAYKDRVASILKDQVPSSDARFIDTINVYLLTVEKYEKLTGSFQGGYAVVNAGVTYTKTNSSFASRVIVTGQWQTVKPPVTEPSPIPALPTPQPVIGTSTKSVMLPIHADALTLDQLFAQGQKASFKVLKRQ